MVSKSSRCKNSICYARQNMKSSVLHFKTDATCSARVHYVTVKGVTMPLTVSLATATKSAHVHYHNWCIWSSVSRDCCRVHAQRSSADILYVKICSSTIQRAECHPVSPVAALEKGLWLLFSIVINGMATVRVRITSTDGPATNVKMAITIWHMIRFSAVLVRHPALLPISKKWQRCGLCMKALRSYENWEL